MKSIFAQNKVGSILETEKRMLYYKLRLSPKVQKCIKNKIFPKIASGYPKEMKLLVEGGKLTKKDEWWNVVEHCLSEALTADILSDLLGLSAKDKDRLIRAVMCHDWDKRIDIAPQDFSKKDHKRAQALLKDAAPDKSIMLITKPESWKNVIVRGNSSFLQRLQCYIDVSTEESNFVHFRRRIEEIIPRNPQLGEDFWDIVIEYSNLLAEEILKKLIKRGVEIRSNDQIPMLIKKEIEHRCFTPC